MSDDEEKHQLLSRRSSAGFNSLRQAVLGAKPSKEEFETFLSTILGHIVKAWPKIGLTKVELHGDIDDAWEQLVGTPSITTPELLAAYQQRWSDLATRIFDDEMAALPDKQSLNIGIGVAARAFLGAALAAFQNENAKLEEVLHAVAASWETIRANYKTAMEEEQEPT